MNQLLGYGSSSDDDKPCTGSNFFLSSSSDEEEAIAMNKPLSTSKTIVSGHTSIEIPDTDFWRDSEALLAMPESERRTQKGQSRSTHHSNIHCKRPSSSLLSSIDDHKRIKTQCKVENTGGNHQCYFKHPSIVPYLNNYSSRPPSRATSTWTAHSNIVNQVNWCCAHHSHLLLSASMDGSVKVWDAFSRQQKPLRILSHGSYSKGIKQAVWSQEGTEILCGGYNRASYLFDVEKGVEMNEFKHDSFVTSVGYHPAQSSVFLTGALNALYCWDTRSQCKPVRKLVYKDSFGQVQDICFRPDGKEFFTCNDQVCRDSADRNVMAWDFDKGVVVSNQIYQERYTCTRLKCHSNEKHLLGQSQGNYIAVFSAHKPYKMDRKKRLEGHYVSGHGVGCDISPDGQMVASGSADGKLHLYNFFSGKNFRQIPVIMEAASDSVCLDVAWHPVLPSTIAVSSLNGCVTLCQ